VSCPGTASVAVSPGAVEVPLRAHQGTHVALVKELDGVRDWADPAWRPGRDGTSDEVTVAHCREHAGRND
jgi:hypothetical protein